MLSKKTQNKSMIGAMLRVTLTLGLASAVVLSCAANSWAASGFDLNCNLSSRALSKQYFFRFSDSDPSASTTFTAKSENGELKGLAINFQKTNANAKGAAPGSVAVAVTIPSNVAIPQGVKQKVIAPGKADTILYSGLASGRLTDISFVCTSVKSSGPSSSFGFSVDPQRDTKEAGDDAQSNDERVSEDLDKLLPADGTDFFAPVTHVGASGASAAR